MSDFESKLHLSLDEVAKKASQERKKAAQAKAGEKKKAVVAQSVGEKKANRQADLNKKRGISESSKPNKAEVKKNVDKQVKKQGGGGGKQGASNKPKQNNNNNSNNSNNNLNNLKIRVNVADIFKTNTKGEKAQIVAAYKKRNPTQGNDEKSERKNAAASNKQSPRKIKAAGKK